MIHDMKFVAAILLHHQYCYLEDQNTLRQLSIWRPRILCGNYTYEDPEYCVATIHNYEELEYCVATIHMKTPNIVWQLYIWRPRILCGNYTFEDPEYCVATTHLKTQNIVWQLHIWRPRILCGNYTYEDSASFLAVGPRQSRWQATWHSQPMHL